MSRTYVVTGAASGIGRAATEELIALGHRVIGVDLHDAEVTADLSDPAGRQLMVDQVAERSGGAIDALIASAGTANKGPTDVQVNFFGAVATLAGLRPLLAAGSNPRAVAVASFAVLDQVDDAIVAACLADDEPAAVAAAEAVSSAEPMRCYASAKRALARWIRRTAPSEGWAGAGIALNAVGPGIVRTPMVADLLDHPELAEMLLAAIPMPYGGILAPEDVAHHLVTLTDPSLRGLTGQTIFLDGGADCVSRGDDIWR